MKKLIALILMLLAICVVAEGVMPYNNGLGFFYHNSDTPIMFVFEDGTGFRFDFKCETLYDTFKTFDYAHSYSKGLFDYTPINITISHKIIYSIGMLPIDSNVVGNFKFILGERSLFYSNSDIGVMPQETNE